MALLCVLLDLGYKVEAMHCNFNLRGEESNRDELFCKELCRLNGVKLHLAHFDTRFYSHQHHVSIEMAARELRYNYFRQLKEELSAESICVAHHKDDCAETILMNLVRGTGLTGLTGIRAKNGCIIRPMLCVSREDIENYLTLKHQEYITDSSNLVNDVKRNKIRLDVMPVLKTLNPSATDAITLSAKHIADALPLLTDALNRYEMECVRAIDGVRNNGETDDFQPIAIDIQRLKSTPSPEYLLYHILTKRGIAPQFTPQVYEHLDSQTGTSWQNNGRVMTIDRGQLLVELVFAGFTSMKLPMPGKYMLSNGDSIVVSVEEKTEAFRIDTSPFVAQLDAESVRWPFVIRAVENGDRFVPFGMNGSKLVSDLLTDRKMSLQQKRRQLCVTDASEQIVWLTGLRISNKHRITSNTIKYVCLRYNKRS